MWHLLSVPPQGGELRVQDFTRWTTNLSLDPESGHKVAKFEVKEAIKASSSSRLSFTTTLVVHCVVRDFGLDINQETIVVQPSRCVQGFAATTLREKDRFLVRNSLCGVVNSRTRVGCSKLVPALISDRMASKNT